MKMVSIQKKALLIRFLLTSDVIYQSRMWWLMNSLPKGDERRLVDFGCGNGFATNWAAHRDWRAIGVSYDQGEIACAQQMSNTLKQRNTSFLLGDIRNLDRVLRSGEKFDVVLCLEVIEHILNDHKLIMDISQRLSSGGQLFLSTPNKSYKHLIGDKISEVEDGNHVRWGYTFEELVDILGIAELKIIQQGEMIGFVNQMVTNLERLTSRLVGRKLSWALTFPLRFLLPLDKIVTAVVKYPYLSLWVIAVKR